jgi:hypothetical protein
MHTNNTHSKLPYNIHTHVLYTCTQILTESFLTTYIHMDFIRALKYSKKAAYNIHTHGLHICTHILTASLTQYTYTWTLYMHTILTASFSGSSYSLGYWSR